jgi:type I restriction enzyme S subunit
VSAQELITEHLDLWTGAVTKKSSSGRGSNRKVELTGVKKLRELILELAVRGLLASQLATDEPANELLQKIIPEVKSLIIEGRFKLPKEVNPNSATDEPFPLPKSWTWCTLDQIAVIARGGSPRPIKSYLTTEPNGLNWIKIGDTTKGSRLITKAAEKIIPAGLKKTRMVYLGDLILSNSMSFGQPYILNIEGCIHDGWLLLRTPEGLLDKVFLYYLLLSPYAMKVFSDAAAGAVVQNLNADKVRRLQVPLPPLDEQHRIVQKVDDLMALCDRLEQQTSDQLEAHETLVETLLGTLTQSENATELADNWARLAAHFDTLFTTKQSIDKLKQAILQLAVMGRLVEQDAEDEPVTFFLRRNGIKSSPFCLCGWAEVALGSLGEIIGGSTPSKSKAEFWNGTFPWVSPKDMKIPLIHNSQDRITEKALQETSLKTVPAQSLLMVVRGMILAHSFPVAITGRPVTINQDMKALVPQKEISAYLLMYLQASEPLIVGLVERSSHGTCKLISEKLWSHVIRLPPLGEQERIVQKVDELMALCDQLKERLNQTNETRCQCSIQFATPASLWTVY